MKTGFFEETPEQKSMTRLLSFILVIAFILFVPAYFVALAFHNESVTDGITIPFIGLILIWLVAAFTPKYLQKILELAASMKGVKIPGMDMLNTVETSKPVETNKSVETSKEAAQ